MEDEESWASRYIPGVRAVSKFIPPPSDARKKWDDRYNKWKNQGTESERDRYPDL